MDHPVVSICIPTYNGARYLGECLESALGQTYASVEILIVDDGSLDDTRAIVSEYARRDRRVRSIDNPRRLGLASNWNRCADLARGEWVKFLFQDDVLEPTCIERMMAATHSSGPPIVICRREIHFEAVPVEMRDVYAKYVGRESIQGVFGDERAIRAQRFCEAVLDHLWHNFLGEPTSALLRRSVFRDFGGFNPDLISICDLEYWIRVGVNTGIVSVPETLATFRLHPTSTSSANAKHRTYRQSVLDPLIMLRQFTFDAAYAPLRRAASLHVPRVSFPTMFGRMALRARTDARFARRDDETSDRWSEWRDLTSRYPEIESSPHVKLARLARLPRRVKRTTARLWRANTAHGSEGAFLGHSERTGHLDRPTRTVGKWP